MKELQIIQKWLNDPITKHYLRYLKERESFCIKEAENIVAKAIYSGEINRTKEEISIFNQIRDFRISYSDFMEACEISNKEDLTAEDEKILINFFNNLIS